MISVRKGSGGVGYAMIQQYNLLRKDVAKSGSYFHVDQTSNGTTGDFHSPATTPLQVTAHNGDGTTATLFLLCANLVSVYNTHIADAVAHLLADTTNTLTSSVTPTTLVAAESLLNDMQTKFNAHLTQTGVHVNNDGTNSSTAAAATNQSTSDTLANELKTKLNAHISSAPAGSFINLVSA